MRNIRSKRQHTESMYSRFALIFRHCYNSAFRQICQDSRLLVDFFSKNQTSNRLSFRFTLEQLSTFRSFKNSLRFALTSFNFVRSTSFNFVRANALTSFHFVSLHSFHSFQLTRSFFHSLMSQVRKRTSSTKMLFFLFNRFTTLSYCLLL